MSDQDFFFDEDEQPAKATAKAPASSQAKGGAAQSAASGGSGQSVSLMVTVLVGVIAALLGMIIGIFVGQSLAGPSVPAATTAPIEQQAAPQLTPEQLQGGELPEGHPDVGGAGSGSPTSSETTGN